MNRRQKPLGRSAIAVSVVLCAALPFAVATTATAQEGPAFRASPHTAPSEEKIVPVGPVQNPPADAKPHRWFTMVALVNSYPTMQSEDLVRRYFDGIMHVLAPDYEDVRTVSDIRDDALLWVPYLGVGYRVSDRVAVFLQAGYTEGKVRTKANNPSIILLPLHTDFEIQRGALYGGIGVDYFPWRMPELRPYKGIGERLRASRPFIGGRLTWVHATYTAKVKVGFKPFRNFIDVEIEDAWRIPSVNTSVGLDVPLGERSLLSFNGGYTFFDERDFDFAGPSYTIGWKFYFR